MATRKKTCAALCQNYRCEGLLLGKKVTSVVVGAIIGTRYYKKGGRPLGCPTQRLQPKATTRESSEGLL
jgi:hypothetical protein